jgi:hypothetical protein
MSAPVMDTAAVNESAPPATRSNGLFARVPAASLRTLVTALELGVLGDYLMRANDVGVNVTLWCWALLAAALMVTVAADVRVDRRRIALLGAAAFFAAVPAWRTTEPLVFFSGVAVLTLLVLSAWTAGVPGVALAQRTIGAYLRAAWTGAMYVFAGAMPLLISELRARSEMRNAYRRPFGAVVRGLALSVPVVFVLGALLMRADAGFEALIGNLVRWDAETIVSHLFLTGFFTWLAAAYLYASLVWNGDVATSSGGMRLGTIEGGIVLGVVSLLFLSFIGVQLRYLFGGTEHVLTTAGLTYAQYARRGFFELVAVTGLTLPLLVGVTSAVHPETVRERRIQRVLASTLVVLLLALVASALGRMRLYEVEYGWTLPRVNATALMMWISGCILWFAATVLRGDARRFALGSVVGGLGVLAVLVAANPADLVVRANAARIATGGDFDAVHAASLGDDAIPALMDVLPVIAPTLDLEGRCAIERGVEHAGPPRAKDGTTDWRAWNVGRMRARTSVERHAESITRILGAASCAELNAQRAQEKAAPAVAVPR